MRSAVKDIVPECTDGTGTNLLLTPGAERSRDAQCTPTLKVVSAIFVEDYSLKYGRKINLSIYF